MDEEILPAEDSCCRTEVCSIRLIVDTASIGFGRKVIGTAMFVKKTICKYISKMYSRTRKTNPHH